MCNGMMTNEIQFALKWQNRRVDKLLKSRQRAGITMNDNIEAYAPETSTWLTLIEDENGDNVDLN